MLSFTSGYFIIAYTSRFLVTCAWHIRQTSTANISNTLIFFHVTYNVYMLCTQLCINMFTNNEVCRAFHGSHVFCRSHFFFVFNAIFVATTCCTTLNRLQIPTTLWQQIDCHVTRGIDFSRNSVALQILPCNNII